MRLMAAGLVAVCVAAGAGGALAEEKRSDRVISGVIGGLLGTPAQSPDAAYSAQERERLTQMLQSGQYVTSRQGEPVDTVVAGVPLTRVEHVYTAKPIPPSQMTSGQYP